MNKEFKLFYNIINCGDGSVSLALYPNERAANKAERKEMKLNGYGWAETSVGSISLKVEDDQLYYYDEKWKTLKQA